MEEPSAGLQCYLWLFLERLLLRLVMLLPEDKRPGPNSIRIYTAVLGVLAVLIVTLRSIRSIRSRLYVRREKRLALQLSSVIEDKCQLLEKLRGVQKEHDALESALRDACREQTKASCTQDILKSTERRTRKAEKEILSLVQDLKRLRHERAEQQQQVAETSKTIHALVHEMRALRSQVTEAKVSIGLCDSNKRGLDRLMTDTLTENGRLLERQKHLVRCAAEWEGEVEELRRQQASLEEDRAHGEQLLREKERLIRCLSEWVPRMEAAARERTQCRTDLSAAEKTKERLTQSVTQLQAECAALVSENLQLEEEKRRLELNFQTLLEHHQERALGLHLKIREGERHLQEQEDKLRHVDGRMSLAARGLEFYTAKAKDLQGELEKTGRFYHRQVASYRKAARVNWAAARTAQGISNSLRRECNYIRMKIAEAGQEFKTSHNNPLARHAAAFLRDTRHSWYHPPRSGHRPLFRSKRPFHPLPTLWEEEEPLAPSPAPPQRGVKALGCTEKPLGPERSQNIGDPLLMV
ncbi:cTAGE family member 4-like [Ctenodactylus gundi]